MEAKEKERTKVNEQKCARRGKRVSKGGIAYYCIEMPLFPDSGIYFLIESTLQFKVHTILRSKQYGLL